MRILKKGKIKRDVFIGTCNRCGTKIECDRKELSGIISDQREGGELCQVQCPTCKNFMHVYQ